MQKFLVGAVIGGVVAYWGHRKTLAMWNAAAKRNADIAKSAS